MSSESASITGYDQTEQDKKLQKRVKSSGPLPRHIAIIMDGNGRWAQKRGNMRLFGHKAGVESVRDITEACAQIGVRYLTLYTFSIENWTRPPAEVNGLMKLVVQTLRNEAERLNKNGVKLVTIGQLERLPEECQIQLQKVIDLTRDNKRMQLCLALSYSGRWDIKEAVKTISRKVQDGAIHPDQIDDDLISSHLSTAAVPDPDLIIRTSGEYRISNFLLWQLAYSELYITETYWPDFRRDELYQAVFSFQMRDRRYGKVKKQISRNPFHKILEEIK